MSKNIIKIAFVIIGAIIGAGFASGQEIYIFFFSYGTEGIIGIIISCLLLGITIYKTFKIILDNDINNYKEFLEYIIKINNRAKKYIIDIINVIINIFILITFFIMIAGFGTYLKENLSMPQIIGSTILALLCIIILSKEIKGILKASELIVPILIAFILIIGIKSANGIDIQNINKYIIKTNHTNWIISSILYTSYNTILLIPTLISMKKILHKKQIGKISQTVTIVITLLALSIYITMIRIDVDISKLEMPISYVISHQYPKLKIIYGIVILASILTTAISLGSGLLQNITNNEKSKKVLLIIICVVSIPVSQIGFSNLISYLYPVFGYLGIIQILMSFKAQIEIKNIRKYNDIKMNKKIINL